jgi:hypothetical protein
MAGNTPIADVPDGATVSTVTDAFDGTATVAATAAATGGTPTTYTITPTPTTSPATFTGTSPVTVSGLSDGTSYTFTAKGVNSTATGPAGSSSSSFTPVLAGSYYSIATTTVGVGGASSITFSSIPSTYTHLQIRLLGRTNRAAASDYVTIILNSDSGANYSYHYLQGDGSSATAGASTGSVYLFLDKLPGANASANVFGAAVFDLLDYTNTSKYKTNRSLGGYDNNGDGIIEFDSGNWRSTSSVTAITLTPGAGTLFSQYSSFALYGVNA